MRHTLSAVTGALAIIACSREPHTGDSDSAASTASACIEVMAACVVPPLLVTRSRSTVGDSSDASPSAAAPAQVASARRRPCSALRPMSTAAAIMASTKKKK